MAKLSGKAAGMCSSRWGRSPSLWLVNTMFKRSPLEGGHDKQKRWLLMKHIFRGPLEQDGISDASATISVSNSSGTHLQPPRVETAYQRGMKDERWLKKPLVKPNIVGAGTPLYSSLCALILCWYPNVVGQIPIHKPCMPSSSNLPSGNLTYIAIENGPFMFDFIYLLNMVYSFIHSFTWLCKTFYQGVCIPLKSNSLSQGTSPLGDGFLTPWTLLCDTLPSLRGMKPWWRRMVSEIYPLIMLRFANWNTCFFFIYVFLEKANSIGFSR